MNEQVWLCFEKLHLQKQAAGQTLTPALNIPFLQVSKKNKLYSKAEKQVVSQKDETDHFMEL